MGISDSEKLGLVKANFDMIDKGIKVVYDVSAYSFKKQIELEYPEWFKGIGLMDGEISIKLKKWCYSPYLISSQSTSCYARST